MTIEEEVATLTEVLHRYCNDRNGPWDGGLAALDRIEGYIEQCADFQRAAEAEHDALRAQLLTCGEEWQREAERRGDERDAVSAECMTWRKAASSAGNRLHAAEEERDALRAALEEIRDTRHGELHCKLVSIARQALARLEEKK